MEGAGSEGETTATGPILLAASRLACPEAAPPPCAELVRLPNPLLVLLVLLLVPLIGCPFSSVVCAPPVCFASVKEAATL